MVFENMSEEERQLYLDVLREGTTPFDRFVARGKMEDTVDIPGPRSKIDRFLFRAIQQTSQDNSTRMIPVIGSAGSGKTHAYWAYKAIERKMATAPSTEESNVPDSLPANWSIVYVPSPPAAVRILLHVYTCLLDELTSNVLKIVAEKLVDRWGGFKKKKLGIFGGQDLEETIQNGIREYPGIFADCVKCLCIFQLDKERSVFAERWLLGEDLDEETLDKLGINSVIESDDICLAMIKLICENVGKTIVLYFDELESPYRMIGPEAEAKFLEILKRIYNEIKNIVIVLAVLKEIWPRVLETADQAMKSRMEQERELEYFKFDDLVMYFAKAMEYFWGQNNLNPPVYPLFPLNEDVLRVIYDKTDGNQRSIIKLIRLFIDKIVLDEMSLEEVIQSSRTEPVPVGTTTPKPKGEVKGTVAAPKVPEKSLIEKIEEMMQDENYTIEANPPSVAGAVLKSIKVLAEKFNRQVSIDMDFKYKIGKKAISLAACIIYQNNKWGLEIPAVKSFDKSGGVAAFYAAKRLADAFGINAIQGAILLVPEGTGGAKFKSLISQFETKLFVFEFNEDNAKFLIQQAIKQPSREAMQIAEKIIGEFQGYMPPEPPIKQPSEPKSPSEEETPESTNDEGSKDT